MNEVRNINRTLRFPSHWAAGSQPAMAHGLLLEPLRASAGDVRDSKLLEKIGLGLSRKILRVATSQKTMPKTHTLSRVQLGTVYKPSWRCPHSRPGSQLRAGYRMILVPSLRPSIATTPPHPSSSATSHHCPSEAPGLVYKALMTQPCFLTI